MPAWEEQVCPKQRHKYCLRKQCKLQYTSPHLSIGRISQHCPSDCETQSITAWSL